MAVRSMTGYGSDLSPEGYLVEIRSLNGRYLDIILRIPSEFFRFEQRIRDILKRFFERGSVELIISKRISEGQIGRLRLNRSYAREYVNILKEFSKMIGKEIDYYPLVNGIRDLVFIDIDDKGLERVARGVFGSIETACRKARGMRDSEGRVIKKVLVGYLRDIRRVCDDIKRRLLDQNCQIRSNLEKKIKELLADHNFDQNRFEMEVLYFINRLDISEEIERISSHLGQFKSIITDSLPAGRRLDFLCQELIREFNTIGSKSTLPDIKRSLIEGKDIVEKLREQVQNIE